MQGQKQPPKAVLLQARVLREAAVKTAQGMVFRMPVAPSHATKR